MGLCALARAALHEGDIDEAERLAVRTRGRCQTLYEPSTRIVASSTLAAVLLAKGDLRSARQTTEEALSVCRQLGAVVYLAETLELMAEIHEAAGEHRAAAAARAEAATLRPTMQFV
jgi:ATP/maltotriose-dependent transcriptional regulator MalT